MSPVQSEPFGKLSDFIEWAETKHGCKARSGVAVTPDGMRTFTKITTPSGKHVIITDVTKDESIPVSEYDYYTRRLGLPRFSP